MGDFSQGGVHETQWVLIFFYYFWKLSAWDVYFDKHGKSILNLFCFILKLIKFSQFPYLKIFPVPSWISFTAVSDFAIWNEAS